MAILIKFDIFGEMLKIYLLFWQNLLDYLINSNFTYQYIQLFVIFANLRVK